MTAAGFVVAVLLLAWVLVRRYCTVGYLVRYLRLVSNRDRLAPAALWNAPGSPEVVVSLTTIPSRCERIVPTLNSMLLQSRPPGRILLNLPPGSTREGREYRLPECVRDDPRITVCPCDADLGPIMKLLPTLERVREPATVIITVDDDTVYPYGLIRTLLEYHERMPGVALGYRGFRIPASGRYLDARMLHANQVDGPYEVDILCGVNGALYLRGQFGDDVFERGGLPPEGFFVDDICISGYLAQRGVRKFIVPFPMREPFSHHVVTSWSNPLWMINRDGTNDQRMIDHYFSGRTRVGLT